MAFGFQWLSKVEQSQVYEKTHNSSIGDVTSPIPTQWMYNASATGSNDASAAVQGVGYFNGANGYMKIGDVIYINTNDPAVHFIWVSNNAGGVVTTTQIV
jgi:hypothetical protein